MSEKSEARRTRKLARAEKDRIDNAVRAMLQHADTRAYLRWLLEIGKFGAQPFAVDPHITAFAAGEANVGLQIFAHITEIDLDGYVLMMKEKMSERPSDSAEPDAADDDTDA